MKILKTYISLFLLSMIFFPAIGQNLQIKPVLEQYFQIKEAFVKSDAAIASQEAKKMQSSLKGISDKKEETNILIKSIREDLEHIANYPDLNHQYTHFESLSESVRKLVKLNGTGGQEVYVQYCPMAFNNKGGSWLSAQKEIRNPYFGNKMLKCGSVKETLR
ncbi:MAG: DUF3347 domain-containing protein [Cytophagaceae bacterium]